MLFLFFLRQSKGQSTLSQMRSFFHAAARAAERDILWILTLRQYNLLVVGGDSIVLFSLMRISMHQVSCWIWIFNRTIWLCGFIFTYLLPEHSIRFGRIGYCGFPMEHSMVLCLKAARNQPWQGHMMLLERVEMIWLPVPKHWNAGDRSKL